MREIERKEKLISDYEDKKKELVEKINGAILARAQAFLALSQAFAATSQELTEMNFGVEIDFSQTSVEELSDKFDRRENSPYLKDRGVISLPNLPSQVTRFLNH